MDDWAKLGLGAVLRGRRCGRAVQQASTTGVKADGTSYPYRQAVCVAGLVWGLLGLYFTYRLSALFVAKGWAAAGMVAVGGGSFLLWYLVKEPSMTHAPSMAAVAAFTWAWATREAAEPSGNGQRSGCLQD